MHGATWG
jgi:predicted nucleic acid-binding protein